ncbi:MAG TPA: sigma factor [Streptosporangiaceae bacterium]|nr:sigma factor [Streptosporangiaceae bacterium]
MAKWPRFDPDADRRLAKALSEGGEQSLAALYDIYAERLRDYCGSLIRDRRVITDIVHDTLIDAHRRTRRMRDRTRLRAWLYAAVRRRCLQRVRHPSLRWDGGGGEPADGEGRALLETAFERLDFLDQESLLLAMRHDLTGDDLGALLGIPARRANARIARARVRADAALDKARRTVAQRCAAGERPWNHEADGEETGSNDTGTGTGTGTGNSDDHEPAKRTPSARSGSVRSASRARPAFDDARLADHMAECPDCRRRAELSLAALLDAAPPAALPSSLRHRVIHTGTDPELAGYRADIAARGGTLNADGFPRQPDIPSYLARRWLFTSGGTVGAAVTAVIAAFLIGPGAPVPGLIWPSYRPEPSISPAHPARRPAERQPSPPARQPGGPGDAAARGDRPGPGSARPGMPASVLIVAPDTIDFGRHDTNATLTLAASRGPLTWHADTSTGRLTLSADSGKIAAGDTAVVKVTFSRGLLELPGRETITVTDSTGREHLIVVVWAGLLL